MISLYGIKVSAPGKVILHGEHSVLYNQFAIAASLGLRTSLTLQEICPRKDCLLVNIELPAVHLKCALSLDDIKKQLFVPSDVETWRNPKTLDHDTHLSKVDAFFESVLPKLNPIHGVQGTALRCFLYILSGIFGSTNVLDRSLNVVIDSSLTVGAGTGSSASFAVCLSAALIQLMKLKTGNTERQFNDDDKALICDWAYNCEKIMHGTPSGIDNTTCTYGSLVGFRKWEPPKISSFNTQLRILLVDTRISRQTKVQVDKVTALWEQNKLAVNSIMNACGHIATSAYEIMEKLSFKDCEDVDALYKQLADLWNMNHCLLASLDVSIAALEDIRSLTSLFSLACKLTGAGGGGYAIVLIPPRVDQRMVDSLRSHLECRGYTVKDTLLGGPGVSLDEITLRKVEP